MPVLDFDLKEVLIRPAAIFEFEEIRNLWSAFIKESFPEATPKPMWWWVQAEEKAISPNYCIFVPIIPDVGIVGFAESLIVANPTFGRIERFIGPGYIKPEFRKTGIHQKLWEIMIEDSKLRGVKTVTSTAYPNMESFWSEFGFILTNRNIEKDI